VATGVFQPGLAYVYSAVGGFKVEIDQGGGFVSDYVDEVVGDPLLYAMTYYIMGVDLVAGIPGVTARPAQRHGPVVWSSTRGRIGTQYNYTGYYAALLSHRAVREEVEYPEWEAWRKRLQ
jgi:hypothetical protein